MKTIATAVSTEKAAQQTASCIAIHIASSTPVRVCSWDVDITLDSNTYSGGVPVKKPKIRANYTAGGTINIGNVDGTFSALMLSGALKKKEIYIYEVYFSDSNAVVGSETLFSGLVGGQDIVGSWFKITLAPFSGGADVQTPRRRIVPSCGLVFKSTECGYSGSETYCSKTYEGCRNSGFPFGGFRFIPKPGTVFTWGNTIITVE